MATRAAPRPAAEISRPAPMVLMPTMEARILGRRGRHLPMAAHIGVRVSSLKVHHNLAAKPGGTHSCSRNGTRVTAAKSLQSAWPEPRVGWSDNRSKKSAHHVISSTPRRLRPSRLDGHPSCQRGLTVDIPRLTRHRRSSVTLAQLVQLSERVAASWGFLDFAIGLSRGL